MGAIRPPGDTRPIISCIFLRVLLILLHGPEVKDFLVSPCARTFATTYTSVGDPAYISLKNRTTRATTSSPYARKKSQKKESGRIVPIQIDIPRAPVP